MRAVFLKFRARRFSSSVRELDLCFSTDENVSDGATKGGDERTRVPPVFVHGRDLFVLECGRLEIALVSDAAPVVMATATLAEGLVEAGLGLGAVPYEGARKGGTSSAGHEGRVDGWGGSRGHFIFLAGNGFEMVRAPVL